MKLRNSTLNDIPAIINIAYQTWPATYASIISMEQIDFMLSAFYNEQIIKAQMLDDEHYFLMAEENETIIGYAHIYLQEDGVYKLSKLYVLPSEHGKHVGKTLLIGIENHLQQIGKDQLILNVNRYNPAVDFYKKMNYSIIETIDIPLDKFWLNDYIMQKTFVIS